MSEKKKKPIGKIVLIVIVLLVVVGVGGSMAGGDKGSSGSDAASGSDAPAQAESQPAEQEPYTVTDEALDGSNPYATYVTGTLVNNTDADKDYIQVEYVLYDADGAQIGTALANTNNLKAGGTWKFEALGTAGPDEVASFELADVTGF